MRVAILGCGAMGTVLGAYMTKNGCNVELIDSYEAHVQALNEKGAHIVGTVDFTVPVKAITPGQMEGIYDVVFLFTKQTANDEVLPNLLPHLGPDSTVCTLQNGVPEPFVAAHVGKARTVGGTGLWGATFQEPGVSELTQDLSRNDHLFEIGEMDGTITPRIRQVADVLGYMGPTAVTDSLMASRWGKLINNACMSGMSAACGTTFGGVLDNDKARACLSYLGHEVKQCCEAWMVTSRAVAAWRLAISCRNCSTSSRLRPLTWPTKPCSTPTSGYSWICTPTCVRPRPACSRTWRKAGPPRCA